MEYYVVILFVDCGGLSSQCVCVVCAVCCLSTCVRGRAYVCRSCSLLSCWRLDRRRGIMKGNEIYNHILSTIISIIIVIDICSLLAQFTIYKNIA